MQKARGQGVSTRRAWEDHRTALRTPLLEVHRVEAGPKALGRTGRGLAERELGECPFLICDAMQVKVRRQEAVRSTRAVLLDVGVTSGGQREILGLGSGPWRDRGGLEASPRPAQKQGPRRRGGRHQRRPRRTAPSRRRELPGRGSAALPSALPTQRTGPSTRQVER